MDQLSPLDSVFLSIEQPSAPQHVGGLVLLDPGRAPDFGFESLLATVDERIRLAPRFARKLREVAGGLDSAWLVDDPAFDVRSHVHRIAVPSPGGMRELAELTGFLFTPPLDRGRPLWEMWWIEGVAEGRVALLMKSHHCLQDGSAGASMGELLCDLEPSPKPPPRARAPVPAPEPGDFRVALRAAQSLAARPGATLRLGGSLLRQGFDILRSLRDPEAPPAPLTFPMVSFNGNPGSRRAFACASVPLAAVKEIGKHYDVTVNDVVLALTGSTVRRYLEQRGELPRKSLVALIAVSLRGAADTQGDNQVTIVAVPWGTDRADPVARLLRIHRAAARSKERARGGPQLPNLLGEALVPGFLSLTMRAFGSAMAGAMVAGNAVVSSIRATPQPLYIAGARMESMYPLSILGPSQGLNITAVSYCGRIDLGFTVDPDLVPEPWTLADGIPLALEELTNA